MKRLHDPETAPYLFVAGVHNEASLGWSAAQAWLNMNPDHQVVASTRSDAGIEFINKQRELHRGRVDQVEADWSLPDANTIVRDQLHYTYGDERRFAGFVHAVAAADRTNFTQPAHALDPSVYVDAFRVSTVSLVQGVQAVQDLLVPNAGVVTFGFGRPGATVEGYGGAMSAAKAGLSQLTVELAASLGQAEPSARTAEIVTGYIPTYSGRGVALAQKVRPGVVEDQFAETALLPDTDSSSQRIAAGQMAAAFMVEPMFSQTTGQTIHVDAGWSLRSANLFPTE
ncbi:MAG: SDR family oxidoreductase [Candidatus Saccharibacteria bacterium]|nr:SDR family oxidoreductase [Candidatus Saccharibacteria bacterium]